MERAGAMAILVSLAGCGGPVVEAEPTTPSAEVPPHPVARIVDHELGVRTPEDWIGEWPALSRAVASFTASRVYESWREAEGGHEHCFEVHFGVRGAINDLNEMPPEGLPHAGSREELAAALASVLDAGAPASARRSESGEPVESNEGDVFGGQRTVRWAVCFPYPAAEARRLEARFVAALAPLHGAEATFATLVPVTQATMERANDAFDLTLQVPIEEGDRARLGAALEAAGFRAREEADCDAEDAAAADDIARLSARSGQEYEYRSASPEVYGIAGWSCAGHAIASIGGHLSPGP